MNSTLKGIFETAKTPRKGKCDASSVFHLQRKSIIVVDGMVVDYLDEVSNLGVTMDTSLSFSAHAKQVSSKVFSRLRSLWPNYNVLSWRSRLMLIKSLIIPVFTYCDSVYSTNLNAASTRVLERAFSACVRFVFSIRRGNSIDDHVKRVLGCPIMEFLRYRRLVLVFKFLVNKAPPFIYDKLQPSTRSTMLILPRHSSAQYNKSFFVNAVSAFNALPNIVKQSSTVSIFKSRCLERLVG